MEQSEVTPMIGRMQPRRSVFVHQAASTLGVCRRTVYNWMRAGRLETVRTVGGTRRVLVESIEAMLESRAGRPSRAVADDAPRKAV